MISSIEVRRYTGDGKLGIVFWLIVIIILVCSVAAWSNTKIVIEKLTKIEAALNITNKKMKRRRRFVAKTKIVKLRRR